MIVIVYIIIGNEFNNFKLLYHNHLYTIILIYLLLLFEKII